ncbi:NAD(P)H-hydrate dehydratase [Jannaschia formosa]|nr:NAD(P)H-hydrate dehydratase [Jannaschia formosa]
MPEDILTAAQMRALERAAIESGAVTGLELMERAGAGAVEAILAEWPELGAGSRAVVLCGPGNNGGDGFVVARLLKERGWEVVCFFSGDAAKLPPDARVNHERWLRHGLVSPLTEEAVGEMRDERLHPGWEVPRTNVVVDALFGTGLTRPVASDLGDAVALLLADLRDGDDAPATRRPRIVCLDVPSGLCAESGRLLEPPGLPRVRADLTVTFGTMKPGHLLADGPELCGKLSIVDLGLPAPSHRAAHRVARPGVQKRSGHKFDHGHALVLAGGVGRGGAGRMAARAALRIGAGLVTVAPPPAALIENASRMDAIMLRAVRDGEALAALLEDARLNALCLGPGLGTGAREAGLVAVALAAKRATVLDGDALTLIAGDAGLAGALHDRCVLTPHMGEFARLAPDLADRLKAPAEAGPAYSKLDAARDLAARLGGTVLLKGPDTVIAGTSGRAAIHTAAYGREAPWLATAGAGDVLAGIVTGLLARGFDLSKACEAAVWLHVEAARAFGPGLIAEDLPEMLPRVLRDLDAGSAS